jgi:hypothetical protein
VQRTRPAVSPSQSLNLPNDSLSVIFSGFKIARERVVNLVLPLIGLGALSLQMDSQASFAAMLRVL